MRNKESERNSEGRDSSRKSSARNDKKVARKLETAFKTSRFPGSFDLRLVASLPRTALRMTELRSRVNAGLNAPFDSPRSLRAGSAPPFHSCAIAILDTR